jgi:lauroyl/myristoyl acyltransferase
LRLCFADQTPRQIRALTFQTFVHFAQAWLDRGWLWHGNPEVLRQRLVLTGAVSELQGLTPVVIFAPHFVGLDAGWTALTQQLPRHFTTIYTNATTPTLKHDTTADHLHPLKQNQTVNPRPCHINDTHTQSASSAAPLASAATNSQKSV